MQLGLVGMGRMGANMARRLMAGGHECVVFDLDQANVQAMVAEGAVGAGSLEEFSKKLTSLRAVWMMVPAGHATESVFGKLLESLSPGDAIIDGGNSYYQDSVRRGQAASARGLHFLDVGTSGGVWGLERGYCLMIGGDPDVVERLNPIFTTLAPGRGEIPPTPGREKTGSTADQGFLHCGPVGSGHFVKMIHNGIEYGVMQAYAEGFDILFNAKKEVIPSERRYDLNLADIAEVWRRGSVIGSWLLDLTASSLAQDGQLSGYSGSVQDSGEGRWTILAAIEEAVEADVLTSALYARFRSRQDHTFAEKVLSAMRFQFGGHVEKPADHKSTG